MSKWDMGIELTPRLSESSTNFCEAQVRIRLHPRPSLSQKDKRVDLDIFAGRGERRGTRTLRGQ